jgi:hypothetical protein
MIRSVSDGMLTDIDRIGRLQRGGFALPGELLGQLTKDARSGLSFLAGRCRFDAPPEQRLAFRELGLSIGLHALEALYRRCQEEPETSIGDASETLKALMKFAPVAEAIESFWRSPRNQSAATWRDHLDINAVMLATSLLPLQFLEI